MDGGALMLAKPLREAAYAGHLDCLHILLYAGADVEALATSDGGKSIQHSLYSAIAGNHAACL